MRTFNDLPEKTFWQPEGKIRKDVKKLVIEAIIELRGQNRYNASMALEELFNIKEGDMENEKENL